MTLQLQELSITLDSNGSLGYVPVTEHAHGISGWLALSTAHETLHLAVHRHLTSVRLKPYKRANNLKYAELLEMIDPCVSPFDSGSQVLGNGFPTDLETGWVAVGPVPVGKRCLAATYQSSGVAGVGEKCIYSRSPLNVP